MQYSQENICGKHLCWGFLIIKLQAFRLFLKRDSNTGISCGYCKIYKSSFLDFAPPPAFDFDQQLTQNVAQIILYYNMRKQFLPCLNWLITCFRFQNMFWKNISCFQFWWKTHIERCTNNYVIPRVKRLQMIKCFQFQDMIWKTEECRVSKNIKLKIRR